MRPDLITSTDRARARGAKKIKPPQPGVRIPRQLRIRWYLYLYTCGKVTPEKCTIGIQCSLDAAEESNFVEQSSECPNTTQLRSSRKRFSKLEECKDINAQKVRWSTSRIMQRYACCRRKTADPYRRARSEASETDGVYGINDGPLPLRKRIWTLIYRCQLPTPYDLDLDLDLFPLGSPDMHAVPSRTGNGL